MTAVLSYRNPVDKLTDFSDLYLDDKNKTLAWIL